MMSSPLPASNARLRWALTAAAFLFGAAIAAIRTRYGPADFDVFWMAGRHPFHPYDPAVAAELKTMMHVDGAWPYLYPPTFLLLAWPFGQLPLTLAYPLWAGTGMGLLMLASTFMVRPTWANALLFLTPPVVFAVAPGQSTPLMGAAAIAGCVLLDRRPALAGALLAVAACIKPQAMVLAPVILWGRWRTIGAAVTTGLGLVAASCVFSPGLWLEWPRAVIAFGDVMPSLARVNPSVLIDSPFWTLPLAAFGLYLAWTQKNLFGLFAGALCVSPYAHDYDLAPLAPLAITWLAERRRLGWGHAVLGAAFLAGLVRWPAASLAFLVAFAVIETPWWRSRFRPPSPPPVRQADRDAVEGAPA
jgi:hypothetical protein